MTEDQLLDHIADLCHDLAIMLFHTHDSRRDLGAGFPDLVLAGPGGVLFRELKNDHGQLRPEQQRWRYRLLAGGTDYGVWRPDQWRSGFIEKELNAIL
jgi:hypothetical protein